MIHRVAWLSVSAVVLTGWCSSVAAQGPGRSQPLQAETKRKVEKTDAQWRKQLTPFQYQVTRLKATEPAGTGKYAHSKGVGVYHCIGCDAPLFSSRAKFESGTGWPSFFQPIDKKAVDTAQDHELGYLRIEVMCNDCGAHLGHVFDDGPAPTGLRYCMNSASLKFEPQAKADPKKKKAADKSEAETEGSTEKGETKPETEAPKSKGGK